MKSGAVRLAGAKAHCIYNVEACSRFAQSSLLYRFSPYPFSFLAPGLLSRTAASNWLTEPHPP